MIKNFSCFDSMTKLKLALFVCLKIDNRSSFVDSDLLEKIKDKIVIKLVIKPY